VTPNASLLGVLYHERTFTPLYQSVHGIEVPSFVNSKDMIGA